MVSPVSNKYFKIALIIELKAPKQCTVVIHEWIFTCAYLGILPYSESKVRVVRYGCYLKKERKEQTIWLYGGKKIKTKRFKGNGRCSRVSPGTRRNYRHREVSVFIESCVSVKWLKTAGKGSFSPSGDCEMFVIFSKNVAWRHVTWFILKLIKVKHGFQVSSSFFSAFLLKAIMTYS